MKPYTPIQKSKEERLNEIQKGNSLWLGIEGRYTNLRIWKGRVHAPNNPDNTEGIYMRLDKANAYSAPLSADSLKYIENKSSSVHKLEKFSFPCSVESLPEILEITKDLIIRRDIVEW